METEEPNKRGPLSRFERAVRAHEMMGAQHPDDHGRIESEYRAAKKALLGRIARGPKP